MNLAEMRQAVFVTKPTFGNILDTWGQKTLLEYYTEAFVPPSPPSERILSVIESEVTKILGTHSGSAAREAIAATAWVNTADHHGLLHHPYFYTAALARSHSRVRQQLPAIVTLPFGGVSLSNDSFPRGFSFHTQNLALERVFFKTLKDRRMPVYALSPMLRSELLHEKNRMKTCDLSPRAAERLFAFFDSILDTDAVWSQPTFSAQLTVLNTILWQQLFEGSRGENVYLQIDDVANRLLLDHHLVSDTNIHQLLFTPAWRDRYVELFTNIPGAHTATAGTHFFWYLDTVQRTRRGLFISGDSLSTREGDVFIALDPERIAVGITNRELMPCTSLILLLVQAEEGLTCGGGSSQLEYLPQSITAWNSLQSKDIGIPSQSTTTPIWCGDNALFTITAPGIKDPELATLIDILMYVDDPATCIDSALETTTIASTIDAILPLLYSMYTKEPAPHKPGTIVPTITIT